MGTLRSRCFNNGFTLVHVFDARDFILSSSLFGLSERLCAGECQHQGLRLSEQTGLAFGITIGYGDRSFQLVECHGGLDWHRTSCCSSGDVDHQPARLHVILWYGCSRCHPRELLSWTEKLCECRQYCKCRTSAYSVDGRCNQYPYLPLPPCNRRIVHQFQ